MNDSPWPLRVMRRLIDRVGHPLAGMVVVALLGYGFVVLVLSGVLHAGLEVENMNRADRAPWLVVLGLPWVLTALGFLAWSMWRTRHAAYHARAVLRPVARVVLTLVAVGVVLEVSALSWAIMAGRICDYGAGGETLRTCEQAAVAAAQGPSVLHAFAAPIILVTVPLATALSLHRIQLRSIAHNAGTPEARHAHAFLVVRLEATYLLAAGLFALLFNAIELVLLSEMVASVRGYEFTWMQDFRNPPPGEVIVELVWIPLALLALPLGVVLSVQATFMRLARGQQLEPARRKRFQDLIGRDALSGILDGGRTGVWIATGFMMALLLIVFAPGVSVILVGDCSDCGGLVHTVWPLLAVLNVVIVAAWAMLLAGALALAERALRGRRLREVALGPSQLLESLYAAGSTTRKQFEKQRSVAQDLARNRPPGEPQHTAGKFLFIMLPCWVMALVIWLLIASLAAFDSNGASSEHLTAFYVEVAVLVVPATIAVVALAFTGRTMSALGKQRTRESLLEFQQRVEHLLHEAHDRTVSSRPMNR